MAETVVVADVGGTNARFAVAEISAQSIEIKQGANYAPAEYDNLDDALDDFLRGGADQSSRCFNRRRGTRI